VESLIIAVALDVKGMILWLLLCNHFSLSRLHFLYLFPSLLLSLSLSVLPFLSFVSSHPFLSSSVFPHFCPPLHQSRSYGSAYFFFLPESPSSTALCADYSEHPLCMSGSNTTQYISIFDVTPPSQLVFIILASS